jgi:hypothetical protein
MLQPECRIDEHGNKFWWLNGQLHREDGPAIEYPAVEYYNGYRAWYLNGECHREDGPACEWTDGRRSWYLNNEKLNPEVAVNDPELQVKYPKLIEAMTVYLVHNS